MNVRYNAALEEGQSGGRHHDWSGSEFNAAKLQGSLVEKYGEEKRQAQLYMNLGLFIFYLACPDARIF
ncbi:hypothetical protein FRY98_12645 [Paenibacillus faecis]|uniref:Uncharacterized protein n=1 Tax=Paenibacillus faecis TaxID=862114 RepID=A0A5D0CWD4_9BACL|nr:hypothetical protein [Paenibacillus faecis]TYA13494.1 hypothetical protein FRY98_12645 [Paenibacillus faecis]